jgi:hypothetical protein
MDSSRDTRSCAPVGSARCTSSIAARTAAAVLMASAPGSRDIDSPIAGCPSMR